MRASIGRESWLAMDCRVATDRAMRNVVRSGRAIPDGTMSDAERFVVEDGVAGAKRESV